jgi:hypothetical protein
MRVDTEVIGDEKVLANIAEMRMRAMDARPATRRVRELFLESNRKVFESEGGSIGEPWAPLAQATIERKSREGLDLRPLHGKTGALAAAATGGKGKRSGATKTTARAGVNVWYSVFTRGTRGGEPRRELTGITRSGEQEVLDIVSDWIVHGRA